MNYTALFILAIIVIAFLGLFVVPRFMLKRALKKVIKVFRDLNATDLKNAKTLEELGLKPRSFLDGMFKLRDYRPYALDLLRKAEIVKVTEDGKLYLLEVRLQEKLGHMGLNKR